VNDEAELASGVGLCRSDISTVHPLVGRLNGNGSRRRNNDRRCRDPVKSRCRRRRLRQRPKISWTTSSTRNAGIPRPSSGWTAPGFRCPDRIFRNETRKSACDKSNSVLKNLKARVFRVAHSREE